MGINAHRAFFSTGEADHYLQGLTLPDHKERRLRDARDAIRDALKAGFRDWAEVIGREELFESAALASVYAYDAEPTLQPKFRGQGSYVYKTLNKPTHPSQEIDLDDGMFLPVSFLARDGSSHPAVISDGYFNAVEAILRQLCARKGWTLITDKDSCVRIEIGDQAHIDLALYAIPDDEFEVLVEKAALASAARFSEFRDDLVSFAEDVYPQIPEDRIMLAHRKEGWKPSDPRRLEDWFHEAIREHGYQLRRVCRYLKGWRDFHWQQCRLSSIALMACAVAAYDEARSAPPENRDDKALLMVAERLPQMLSDRIPNPVVDRQYLDEGWEDCRSDLVGKARTLAAGLGGALSRHETREAIQDLLATFGIFMPDDPATLSVDGAPSILTTGLLASFADQPEAQTAVQKDGDDRYG